MKEGYIRFIDSELVSEVVLKIIIIQIKPVPRLAEFVQRFISERFLLDYRDNEKLTFRLNQVLSRVRLPSLTPAFVPVLGQLRSLLRPYVESLLIPDSVSEDSHDEIRP